MPFNMTKLPHYFCFELNPVNPYNFKLTVKKPAGWALFTPFEIFERDTLWTAFYEGGVVLGVKLKSRGSVEKSRMSVGVFSRGVLTKSLRERIKHAVSEKLGAGQDLSGFYRMARKDGILKHVVDDLYGMHDTNSGSVFDTALLAITLQMTNIKRSNQMMDSLIRNYGESAEFDGKKIMLWPRPERIAVLSPRTLSKKCNLGYRAKSIVRLAKKLSREKFPSVEELQQLKPEEARDLLLMLPGIGDYSADIINPHGGFPIDVWSVDVFSMLFYGKEPKNARAAVEKIKKAGIKRWKSWAWMAFYYVAQDLASLSKKLGVRLRLE